MPMTRDEMYGSISLSLAEQLHQNIKVFDRDVSTAESAGAVSATGELLLLVSAGAAADSCDLLTDSHHHCDTAHRCISTHCR